MCIYATTFHDNKTTFLLRSSRNSSPTKEGLSKRLRLNKAPRKIALKINALFLFRRIFFSATKKKKFRQREQKNLCARKRKRLKCYLCLFNKQQRFERLQKKTLLLRKLTFLYPFDSINNNGKRKHTSNFFAAAARRRGWTIFPLNFYRSSRTRKGAKDKITAKRFLHVLYRKFSERKKMNAGMKLNEF